MLSKTIKYLFSWFDHFSRLWQKKWKKSLVFLRNEKTWLFAFEIYWPLVNGYYIRNICIAKHYVLVLLGLFVLVDCKLEILNGMPRINLHPRPGQLLMYTNVPRLLLSHCTRKQAAGTAETVLASRQAIADGEINCRNGVRVMSRNLFFLKLTSFEQVPGDNTCGGWKHRNLSDPDCLRVCTVSVFSSPAELS